MLDILRPEARAQDVGILAEQSIDITPDRDRRDAETLEDFYSTSLVVGGGSWGPVGDSTVERSISYVGLLEVGGCSTVGSGCDRRQGTRAQPGRRVDETSASDVDKQSDGVEEVGSDDRMLDVGDNELVLELSEKAGEVELQDAIPERLDLGPVRRSQLH